MEDVEEERIEIKQFFTDHLNLALRAGACLAEFKLIQLKIIDIYL